MIVKHIPARPAGRNTTTGRARHARNLVDYLHQPEKQSEEKAYIADYMLREKIGKPIGERLFHVGSRGFVSETMAGQRAEMISLAHMAKRSSSPVDHWLLSWREGELPTPEQIDETVALFLGHCGVAGQPCIYACHGDTHNRHVHIALNRYDRFADRMVEINDAFDLEAAHQAVALIVDRFGWEAEAGARYVVKNGALELSKSARDKQKEGLTSVRLASAKFENRTGYRSAQRIAQEEALPVIAAAATWTALHEGLATIGMSYVAVGTNGAKLVIGDAAVRASDVTRSITITSLARRLGPFEPASPAAEPALRSPENDRLPHAIRADEYRALRDEYDEWRAAQKARDSEKAAERSGAHRDVARAAAHRHAADKVKRSPKPPPDLESWYFEQNEGGLADLWRNRSRRTPVELAGTLRGDVGVAEIDGYRSYPCSDGARYALGPDRPTAFIDRGDRVQVLPGTDEALLAALRLAILKFEPPIRVIGSPAFKARASAIAAKNGLGHFLVGDAGYVQATSAAKRSSSQRRVSVDRGNSQASDVDRAALSPPENRQKTAGTRSARSAGRLADIAAGLARHDDEPIRAKGPKKDTPLSVPRREIER